MRILINEDAAIDETEIIVNCKKCDNGILGVIDILRSYDQKITGVKDGRTFILDTKDIIYCDSVDKKTFIYTPDAIYETPLRLYELEKRLSSGVFLRASKQNIINLLKIKSLRPEITGKIEVTFENGERLYASRQYSSALKSKLGM